MTIYRKILITILIPALVSSCTRESFKKETAKALIVGQWNSYEIGNSASGFVPGKETLISGGYSSGLFFNDYGQFGPRFYDRIGWNEQGSDGTFAFKNEDKLVLTYSPGTKDETRRELQIIKLDKDHLWLADSFFVNQTNPNPMEYHLERVIQKDPPPKIAFQIEQTNTTKKIFNTAVKKSTFKYSSSYWDQRAGSNVVLLTRKIVLAVELQNGELVEFGFSFLKGEAREALILENEYVDQWGNASGAGWNYKSSIVEAENFYKGFEQANISINSNGIFYKEVNDNFKVSVEKRVISGNEKSLVTINFSGVAYGGYDPTGEFQEVYKITNGMFQGIIE